MNEIIINDLYKYKKDTYVLEVLEFALTKLNIKDNSLSVIYVDDDYIKEINKEFRGLDKITDVISFAFKDNDIISQNLLGDIYICIPQMIRQAQEYNHSEKRELSFLAVHGLLHLLGYDHMNKEDEIKMFKLQDEILNELNII